MSNHKSTELALKNLEVQVGQLAKQIADKSSNNFVANTEQNPKEECKAVMTMSKRFVEAKDEHSIVHKKKTADKKDTDDKKNEVKGETTSRKHISIGSRPTVQYDTRRYKYNLHVLKRDVVTSETSAPGSPSVPSSPHQEQPEFNIQPIQMIPGQAPVPEKLVPKRQQGVKTSENPSLATSPREVDTEMDKKIRSIVSSILKNASVPEADKDVPTSSTPNVSVPDADKDVPTSSTPNAEVLPSPSEEESTEEEDQATEETPAPRAPEPAPGDLIDLEEVESDEEPIANKLAPGIAERLQSRKGKTPIKRSGRIKTMAQKKSTPITPTTSRRSKVAIPSKKRKEISSSDSDDDVELDVPDIKRAKTSGKKVPGNVPDAPLDNISFHSIGNVERWKFVYQRRLALERELGRDALDCKEIMDLIKAAGLLKTVTKLGDCYESLVREFIVNIPSDITNRKSDEYQKVFVRGKCVRFSPAVINKYLGRPTDGVVDIAVSEHQISKEITAKQVQHWPKKGKLSAGKLSVKYAILHRIGAANWVPTNHTSTVATGLGKFLYAVGTKSKFNFGNYIFDQTVKHSESFAVKLPIAFPTVLCGIMLSQHPNMLNHIDSVMKRESALSLHYKLFEGTHVPDIVSTSGKAAASGAVSKDALIAELKDTCKVLEATIKATTEKKMELERLIKRLSDILRIIHQSSPESEIDADSLNTFLETPMIAYRLQREKGCLMHTWPRVHLELIGPSWEDSQEGYDYTSLGVECPLILQLGPHITHNCWNPEDLTVSIRGARRARARARPAELPSTSIAPTPASTSAGPFVPCFEAMLQSIHQGQIILQQSLQMVAPLDSILSVEQFNEIVAWSGTQPSLHREDEGPTAQVEETQVRHVAAATPERSLEATSEPSAQGEDIPSPQPAADPSTPLLEMPQDPTTSFLAMDTSPPATLVLHLTDEEDVQTQDTQDRSHDF
ncbi:hypothetical protein HKD37_17G048159 [Glycine soja]